MNKEPPPCAMWLHSLLQPFLPHKWANVVSNGVSRRRSLKQVVASRRRDITAKISQPEAVQLDPRKDTFDPAFSHVNLSLLHRAQHFASLIITAQHVPPWHAMQGRGPAALHPGRMPLSSRRSPPRRRTRRAHDGIQTTTSQGAPGPSRARISAMPQAQPLHQESTGSIDWRRNSPSQCSLCPCSPRACRARADCRQIWFQNRRAREKMMRRVREFKQSQQLSGVARRDDGVGTQSARDCQCKQEGCDTSPSKCSEDLDCDKSSVAQLLEDVEFAPHDACFCLQDKAGEPS